MATQIADIKAAPSLKLADRIDIIKNKRWFSFVFPVSMLIFLFLLFTIMTGGDFLKKSVLLGVFNQALITGTIATAVSFIYTTGNIDFSVGSVMGLSCVFGALTFRATNNALLMILVTLGSGLLLMLLNCTLGVVLNVKSSMVAIVGMSVYSALSVIIVGAQPIRIDSAICKALETTFRYPAFIIYFALCFLVFHKTGIGRKLRFIGGNPTCAKQTGINGVKYQYISFLLAGIGVGLAGVFQIFRTASIGGTIATSMGMDVMLATVLGGMSIFGGAKSNSYAGIIGAVTVTVLNKGLLMIGVSATMIQGVRGVIFLLLVLLNCERQATLPSRQQF